jgi:hypothetical protein
MPNIIDGSFDTPEGHKLFVGRRPGESSDDFAARAMAMLLQTETHWVLDKVLSSAPEDWDILPSGRWLEARNRTEPKLRLRLTALPSSSGGSIGHLVVDSGDQQVADSWGDLKEGYVYLPRTDTGTITTGQAILWSLVHEIRGLGDRYDSAFERSGLIVE